MRKAPRLFRVRSAGLLSWLGVLEFLCDKPEHYVINGGPSGRGEALEFLAFLDRHSDFYFRLPVRTTPLCVSFFAHGLIVVPHLDNH